MAPARIPGRPARCHPFALFVLSAIDANKRPTNDLRTGAVIVAAAVWPVTLAIVLGTTVGEVARKRV